MSRPSPTDTSGPQSSQELPLSHQLSRFSPQGASTYGPDGGKERRNPSVTPRKFNRFFTPRSHESLQLTSARQALHDITNSRNETQSSPLRPFKSISGQENGTTALTGDLKRRKVIHTPESSPHHDLSNSKNHETSLTLMENGGSKEEELNHIQSSPCERIAECIEEDEDQQPPVPLKRIIPFEERGLGAQLLQLSMGISTRPRRQHHIYPVNDWQNETASFYSKPEDVHICTGIEGPQRCIPFCAASCNTNTLVAIGDEEGRVRLLESGEDGKPNFMDTFLAFRVHTNAIIDMTFSKDDSLLATASGDQSARVIDMATQTTISILGNHSASLKQVRFQPGSHNNSVLATSSRDGSVQIWDLRCTGSDGPQQRIPGFVETVETRTRSGSRKVNYGRAVNSIYDAHRPAHHTRQTQALVPADPPSRGEAAGRIGDVSVTAIAFLPEGQEHLLLTASEADASVKLWDIRALQNKRKIQVPVSCIRQPKSHSQWRHFGISSLNISGDGSRLYTVCKDNTVYAYSTAHFILGYAPELSLANHGRRIPQRNTQEGLGPLYGFRHPQLHITSFYVKSAIRKAKSGKSEMLAIGSSDGCAVLFPTDERYFPRQARNQQDMNTGPRESPSLLRQRPGLKRTGSGLGLAGRVDDSIPIYTHGTPLIRGHDREVGSLAWTFEGGLITLGDDFLVRRWREGADARELRVGGEGGGKRWGCGWANVNEKYDEDDD